MENIHVLPTDKPSRLHLGDNGNFVFGMVRTSIESRNNAFTNKHIYITSDEEPKVNDFYFDFEYQKVRKCETGYYNKGSKKIILTTDQDLIKDGVQAIDDEFLEWFVKNPSCESVDVRKETYAEYKKNSYNDIYLYEIIIPQEKPKQETLEELKKWKEEALIAHEINQKFIEKLMAERKSMYSEEEVRKISVEFFYHWWNAKGSNTEQEFDEWFEQRARLTLISQSDLASLKVNFQHLENGLMI